jgi:hypothetical protein
MPVALRTFSERGHARLFSFERLGAEMTHDRHEAGKARDYVAYLLRLWREKGGESTQWRASLQDPHTGEKEGFASLGALFAYLRRVVAVEPDSEGEQHSDDKNRLL